MLLERLFKRVRDAEALPTRAPTSVDDDLAGEAAPQDCVITSLPPTPCDEDDSSLDARVDEASLESFPASDSPARRTA